MFIFNKEFHEGIIGIIAAKLSQIFNKPCFVVTESQNLLKCSIRSQNNIKINKTIKTTLIIKTIETMRTARATGIIMIMKTNRITYKTKLKLDKEVGGGVLRRRRN